MPREVPTANASPPGTRRAWATIDLGALARNFDRLATLVAPARVIAVVKADGYGHGAVPVARALEGRAAAVAVSLVEEGIELRRAGIASPILVLGPVGAGGPALCERHALVPVVSGLDQLAIFREWSAARREPFPIHLKFDTGMSRLGVPAEQAGAAFDLVRQSPGLALAGVLSHFAEAETPESASNPTQERRFDAVLAALSPAERKTALVHFGNSAAALYLPESRHDAVRSGLVLYGIDPTGGAALPLEPVMTVSAELVQVRDVEPGTRAGYGGRWQAERRSRLGVVPIGYADGYPWRLGGRAGMLVRGRRVPIAGSVSMDMTLVDLTAVGGEAGEPVVVIGRQGSERIGIEELASLAGTIPYEICCGFRMRLARRVEMSERSSISSGSPQDVEVAR